jgi:hypothetical protein
MDLIAIQKYLTQKNYAILADNAMWKTGLETKKDKYL